MPLFGNKDEKGIPFDLRKYFNDRINQAGYTTLSGDKREQFLQEFYRYYQDDLAKRCINSLSDAHVAEFEAMLQRNPPPTPQQADDFLRKHDPQYKQHVRDAKDMMIVYITRYLRANANR